MVYRFYLLLIVLFHLSHTLTYGQCTGCTPLVYEGFAYSANTPIQDQVGGTGWSGGWEVQGGNVSVPGYMASPNSLTTGTLRTNYGHLSGGSNYVQFGRAFNVSATGPLAPFRNSNGFVGQAGTTMWMSVVLQKNVDNDQTVMVGLHNGNIVWYNPQDQPRLEVGYFGAASDQGGQRYWSLRLGQTVTRTSIPVSASTPTLMVLKLSFSANQTDIDFWVNPATLGSGTPPTPTLTTNYATAFQFRSLVGYLGSGAGQGRLDEIRVASTYQCVVPDAGVTENQLPIARFTPSSITGTVPVSISFDASQSSDGDGQLVRYDWDFNDGQRATGAIVNHTFIYPGLQNVTLTVTDNCSLVSGQVIALTLRGADGALPCYTTTPRLDKMASCTSNNGQISVSGGNSSTLTNAQGLTYVGSGGVFANLAPQAYTLTVVGTGGCRDQFALRVAVDSITCPGWTPRPYTMNMGMGLEGLAYWDKSRAFKDFMKTAGRLFTYTTAGSSPWSTDLQNHVPRDAAGYPLQLPYTVTTAPESTYNGQPQGMRLVLSAEGHMPLGQYAFLYDGDGTMTFSGGIRRVTGQPTVAGRILVEVHNTGNIWVDISSSTLSNHLRNIRLVRVEDEATYQTQPFSETFLEKTCQWSVLRFMDWQLTNGSTLTNWSDRARMDEYSQTLGKGAAYEHIIQLANTLQKDIWINVPHQASDDYIRQMARLFRDGLNSGINVYLEYSNEVWNWQFQQAHWVDQNGPSFLSYPRKYALRAQLVFRIWHEEWGAQKNRVKRVAATQSVNNWLGQQILAHLNGEFDFFSPTWYFGYQDDPTAYAQLQALGAAATPTDVLNAARSGFHRFWPSVRQNYRDAAMWGKPVALYEGGQHMTSNPTIEPFQEANYQAQIEPGMFTLYREVLDSLARWRTHTATAFVLTGLRKSRYGSWGHLEEIDQDTLVTPAPKYQALLRHISPQKRLLCQCSVNAEPFVLTSFTASNGLCNALSSTLTASVTGGSALTYAFEGPGLNQRGTLNRAVISTPGTYTVVVGPESSCPQTGTLTVSGLGGGAASLWASASRFCQGSSVTLQATGGSNYSFSGPGLNQQGSDSQAIVNQAGTYSVVVTDANGCTASAALSLTVLPTPTPSLIISGPCTNTSITLTATGGQQYAFSGPGVVSQTGGRVCFLVGNYLVCRTTDGTAVVNQTGIYSVNVTGENGCQRVISLSVSSLACER